MTNTTFCYQKDILVSWCQTSAAISRKDWKWVLTAKTNERGGEGGAKLLLNLLMEFSSFSPSSLCGSVINGGIMAFVG